MIVNQIFLYFLLQPCSTVFTIAPLGLLLVIVNAISFWRQDKFITNLMTNYESFLLLLAVKRY